MTPSAALTDRALTYDVVGETLRSAENWAARTSRLTAYERSIQIGEGDDCWATATRDVLRWAVKLRSGFTVEAADGLPRPTRSVVPGERVWLVARTGPVRIKEPALVVAVVDEPDRQGFAYGTLSGHPVNGEEAFLVDRRADGTVWFTIRSLSGPAAGRWRLGYPLVLVGQRVFRRRYLRALLS